MIRRLTGLFLAIALAAGLSACGDTWRGVKQDTGDNLKATGAAIESAGEAVKN